MCKIVYLYKKNVMHLVNQPNENNQEGQQSHYSNSSANQGSNNYGNYNRNNNNGAPIDNKKIAAGLLGIFLGPWGVHKFYLGYTTEGIIQILITLFSCGTLGILGIIEGIVYLTKSDEEFYQIYQVNKKGWF